jgi:hypothetical protein
MKVSRRCPSCGVRRSKVEVRAQVCWICDWDNEDYSDIEEALIPEEVWEDEASEVPEEVPKVRLPCGEVVITPAYFGVTDGERMPHYLIRCECGWVAGAQSRRDAKEFRNAHLDRKIGVT